jgi:hypothetical protein
MAQLYRYLFPVMWLGWMAYWWVASRDVKKTSRHESLRSRLSHIVPLTIAAILLALPRSPVPVLGEHFLPGGLWTFWTGAALTLAGLLFTDRPACIWEQIGAVRSPSSRTTN